MVGLSASQLPPETLRPGDVLEYYSQGFVCGDRRGHRVGIVLKISGVRGDPYPVALDTQEPLPLTNMVRRRFDIAGTAVLLNSVRWRKLRSFHLVPGEYEAPTRATRLRDALKAHLDEAFSSLGGSVGAVNDSACPRRINKGLAVRPPVDAGVASSAASSTPNTALDALQSCVPEPSESPSADTPEDYSETSFEDHVNELRRMIIVDERDVTDAELLDAHSFVESVPTRYQRTKRRHQKKFKAGEWGNDRRSRKRRHQRLAGITRSGLQIYHAHSTKAQKVKALLRVAGLRKRLRELHERRPTYQEPPDSGYFFPQEKPWPTEVTKITECMNPDNVSFKDIGDYGSCLCVGDCFMDSCSNATGALYCTAESCNLDARCSNAPRSLETLKLFDTDRVGLGVYTCTDLDVGDVIGEYAGVLCEYEPYIEGLPGQRLKHNTGYTMLLNAKSRTNKYVYIESLDSGFTTRFISHSCSPNAAFVEVQNRASVKVLVRMIADVKAGAQITVNYGNQTWFKCACEQCWSEETTL
eukprot:jgi/Phyca11/111174/e_gw1.19.489.1